MFCTNCGKEMSDGSLFCDRCGKKIKIPPNNSYNRNINWNGSDTSNSSSVVDDSPGTGNEWEKVAHVITPAIVYRISSVIIMVFFFIPTFLVSCKTNTDINEYVSAAHTVIGYESDMEAFRVDPQPIVLFLIVIPIAIFLLSFYDILDRKKTNYTIFFLALSELIGWIYFQNAVKAYVDRYEAWRVRSLPSFFLNILTIGVIICVSLYCSFVEQNAREPDPVPIRECDDVSNERLRLCIQCRKVFAVSSETARSCPKCGSVLKNVNIPVVKWERMNPQQKNEVLSKMFYENTEI